MHPETKPPLKLEHCQLDRLEIEVASPEETETFVDDGIDVDYDLFVRDEDLSRFAIALTLDMQAPAGQPELFGPYVIRATVIGLFALLEPLTQSEVPEKFAVNGLTILYGMLRGIVGTATAWTGKPALLPTFYFTPLVKSKRAASAAPAQIDGAVAT